MSHLPAEMKLLSILAKTLEKQKLNISCSALFQIETRVKLKQFLTGYLWKHFFASKSPHTPLSLISLTILVALMPCTQF